MEKFADQSTLRIMCKISGVLNTFPPPTDDTNAAAMIASSSCTATTSLKPQSPIVQCASASSER